MTDRFCRVFIVIILASRSDKMPILYASFGQPRENCLAVDGRKLSTAKRSSVDELATGALEFVSLDRIFGRRTVPVKYPGYCHVPIA